MEADRDDKFGPAIILALGKLQSLANPDSLELPGILFLSLPQQNGVSSSQFYVSCHVICKISLLSSSLSRLESCGAQVSIHIFLRMCYFRAI